MKRWIMIAVAAATLMLVGYAVLHRGSDEDAVRETLRRAANAVRVIEGENPVLRATRVRGELVELLLPDVAVNIPELTEVTKGRDPLIGVAVGAAQLWERADIPMTFARVQVDSEFASAEVTATLSATRHGGTTERDLRKCSFRLLRRDGRFQISEITVYPKDAS